MYMGKRMGNTLFSYATILQAQATLDRKGQSKNEWESEVIIGNQKLERIFGPKGAFSPPKLMEISRRAYHQAEAFWNLLSEKAGILLKWAQLLPGLWMLS